MTCAECGSAETFTAVMAGPPSVRVCCKRCGHVEPISPELFWATHKGPWSGRGRA